MGGGPSKGEEVNQSHTEDIKINHQKFQNFTYLEPEDLLQITLDINSDKDHKYWDGQLKRLSFFQDKEALLLPTRHEHKSKGFCGTAGAVKICYENYPYLFQEEIENRIEMGKHFQEEELWYLLYSLVTSAKDFNKIDSKIGDVRPYNIFINEEGQIKIANLYSWPYEKTNFDKTAFEKTLTYLSPEEMRLIAKGQLQNKTDRIRSESFSIGLTLLQAGLLFPAKNLYSISNFTVDVQSLEKRVIDWMNMQFMGENNVVKGYSPLLKNIVAAMCNPDERCRLTSLQVQQQLRTYQSQILNLKEFEHGNIKLNMNVPTQLMVEQSPTEVVYSPPRQQGTVMAIPQQSITVNNYPEPKLNSSPPPPPPSYIVTTDTKPVNSSVRFNHGQTVYINQDQFKNRTTVPVQFNSNVPTVPTGVYEQQFFKYSSMNQNPTPTTTTVGPYIPSITNPPPPPQPNTLNFHSPSGFTTFNPTGGNFSSSSQTSNTRVVTSTTVPMGSSDAPSSDFLKRIDEQLQASRRQFPS